MAEFIRKNVDPHTFYAIWKITESVEELESAIELREGEKQLYASFVAESRKKQWLAYRILVRELMKPGDFSVEYDPAGKPFLAGSDLHISVSHSGDMAAVIISRNTCVGIDIEKVRTRVYGVRERFLSAAELGAFSNEADYEMLTLAWSAKEALYKLYGIRELDFREHIRLELPSEPGQIFSAEINYGSKKEEFSLFSERIDGFVLVYVTGAVRLRI